MKFEKYKYIINIYENRFRTFNRPACFSMEWNSQKQAVFPVFMLVGFRRRSISSRLLRVTINFRLNRCKAKTNQPTR